MQKAGRVIGKQFAWILIWQFREEALMKFTGNWMNPSPCTWNMSVVYPKGNSAGF